MKIINRFRNARRWNLGQPVKADRLNSDASQHQQVPVAHQLTRSVQVAPKPGRGLVGSVRKAMGRS